MVIGLIVLGICILGSVTLICFKGVSVTYNKSFTVRDERMEAHLTEEQLKTLEKDLNDTNPEPKPKEINVETMAGPMDSVIGEIQELFGPVKEDED